MICTCPCHTFSGHLINRRASLGARLVALRERLPEIEKLARRTPPKTLLAEWSKVQVAKLAAPALRAELAALEEEYREVRVLERTRTS